MLTLLQLAQQCRVTSAKPYERTLFYQSAFCICCTCVFFMFYKIFGIIYLYIKPETSSLLWNKIYNVVKLITSGAYRQILPKYLSMYSIISYPHFIPTQTTPLPTPSSLVSILLYCGTP